MLDLGKLNYPVHFQAVLNATRGMFELLVDLKLLVDDPALADKYHAFPFVARFSAAKKLIDYLNTDRTYAPPAKPEKRRIFISDGANQKKFDDLRKEHWGTDKKGDLITPSHWSNLDLAARVGRLGSAESRRYRDIYSMCSWFVHSGAAGIAGISPDGLLAAFGWGHGKIQEMFAEGTEILCKTLHLFTASPGLQQELELAKVAPAIFLDPELTGPPSNS